MTMKEKTIKSIKFILYTVMFTSIVTTFILFTLTTNLVYVFLHQQIGNCLASTLYFTIIKLWFTTTSFTLMLLGLKFYFNKQEVKENEQ